MFPTISPHFSVGIVIFFWAISYLPYSVRHSEDNLDCNVIKCHQIRKSRICPQHRLKYIISTKRPLCSCKGKSLELNLLFAQFRTCSVTSGAQRNRIGGKRILLKVSKIGLTVQQQCTLLWCRVVGLAGCLVLIFCLNRHQYCSITNFGSLSLAAPALPRHTPVAATHCLPQRSYSTAINMK